MFSSSRAIALREAGRMHSLLSLLHYLVTVFFTFLYFILNPVATDKAHLQMTSKSGMYEHQKEGGPLLWPQ